MHTCLFKVVHTNFRVDAIRKKQGKDARLETPRWCLDLDFLDFDSTPQKASL